jgi:hypothetical protein
MLERINKMKIFIILSFLIACNNIHGNSSFNDYLNNFKSHKLPLILDKSNIYSYNEMIYDTESERHISNVFLSIDSSYFDYLKNKETDSKYEVNYRSLYQIFNKEDYKGLIVLEDYSFDNEVSGMWFHLYTYDNFGKIIDEKIIGGYEIDNKEQFFTIDKDLGIVTRLYEFLNSPDGDDKNMYAKESILQYKISETGKIITVSSQEKEAKFLETKNGYTEIK